MIKILPFCFLLFFIPNNTNGQVCSNPGKNGNGIGLTGIINTYYPGIGSANAGNTTISVGSPVGALNSISAGDLLLVIQMQNGTINSSNSINYGDGSTGSGLNSAGQSGLYEYVLATSDVSGGLVNIKGLGTGGGLLNTYISSNASLLNGRSTFQVVRVPQYSSAQISSGLTALYWNGVTGGILAFDVAGALNFNSSSINLDGKGFRGGGGINLNGGHTGSNTDYVIFSDSLTGGSKGEGIAGTPKYVYSIESGNVITNLGSEGYPSGSFARGAPANAGGGGTDGNPALNNQNSGGGGGANQGRGGKGGNSAISNLGIGGLGGSITTGSGRLFLGGGGGAGSRDLGSGFQSSGGSGGGIILIRTGSVVGSGGLSANGTIGITPSGGEGGGGGGGAGGSIVLTSYQGSNSGLNITANGATGASSNTGSSNPSTSIGPGGGGGGGLVQISKPASSVQVNPGLAGTTTTLLASYGASSGSGGLLVSNFTDNSLVGVSSGAACSSDLGVLLSTSNPNPIINSKIILTIKVTNNGPNSGSGITVLDHIPTGYTYISDNGSGAYQPLNGLWTLGNLSNGLSQTLSITVQVNKSGAYLDSAQVSSLSYDPIIGNNVSTISTAPYTLPIPQPDSTTTLAGKSIVLNHITGNDSAGTYPINPGSVDLDTLTSGIQTSINIPGQGSFGISNSDNILFTPQPGFSGISKTYYSIADQFGNRSIKFASLQVKVYPVAIRDTISTNANTSVIVSVWKNDLGKINPGSVKVLSGPFSGTAVVNPATGDIQYQPQSGFLGLDSLSYLICDKTMPNSLCSSPAFLVITVKAPMFIYPLPGIHFASTTSGKAVSLPAITKTDKAGTYSIDSSLVDIDTTQNGVQNSYLVPGKGTFLVDNFGDIRFLPQKGYSGIVSIHYSESDIAGNISPKFGTIQITVNPVAINDKDSTIENAPIVLPILVNDLGKIDPKTLKINSSALHGVLKINTDGTVTYTPSTDYIGSDSFSYSVCDSTLPTPLCSGFATVYLNIKPKIQVPLHSDIGIAITGPTNLKAGDTITYTIVITNYGPDKGIGLTLTDQLNSGYTLIKASLSSSLGSASYNASNQTIIWTLDTLNPGQSVTIQFKGMANGTGNLINSALVTSTSSDPNLVNNSASITSIIGDIQFFIPKAFTPNGDGMNDLFEIGGLQPYPDNTMEIYNRWGNIVYKTTGYGKNGANFWDGSGLNDGTYFYLLKINMGGTVKSLSGYITILKNLNH